MEIDNQLYPNLIYTTFFVRILIYNSKLMSAMRGGEETTKDKEIPKSSNSRICLKTSVNFRHISRTIHAQ